MLNIGWAIKMKGFKISNACKLYGEGYTDCGDIMEVIGNSVTMNRFTGAQHLFCVKHFYKNGNSCMVVKHSFCTEFELHNLNEYAIRLLLKHTHGTIKDLKITKCS